MAETVPQGGAARSGALRSSSEAPRSGSSAPGRRSAVTDHPTCPATSLRVFGSKSAFAPGYLRFLGANYTSGGTELSQVHRRDAG